MVLYCNQFNRGSSHKMWSKSNRSGKLSKQEILKRHNSPGPSIQEIMGSIPEFMLACWKCIFSSTLPSFLFGRWLFSHLSPPPTHTHFRLVTDPQFTISMYMKQVGGQLVYLSKKQPRSAATDSCLARKRSWVQSSTLPSFLGDGYFHFVPTPTSDGPHTQVILLFTSSSQ